ncbi:hypothetical protein IQ06DRAFT_144702 [Phaeosphaeriaceae sp. SRC1lsM3a]|nr:hypothetical protein IQ06DRAFT_144702 [Stagonospora sp. SRC1lsM3a]
MDPIKKSGRTNIIDCLDAIALAQQGQRKAQKKPKKALTVSSAPVKSGGSKAGPSKKAGANQDAGDFVESSRLKPAKKTAKEVTTARYYEKNGVKIPLFEKGGKKRAHARLAKGLRNKGTDILLDIVQEYAGVSKRIEFKNADKTKAEIAEWVEEVETRALGSHPKSTLGFVKDDSMVNTGDVLIVDPDPKPASETTKYKGKGKAPVHAAVQNQEDTATKSNASTNDERCKARAERPKSKKAKRLPKLSEGMDEGTPNQCTEEYKQQEEQARLEGFMKRTSIDINNPDASSRLVVLHDQDEVRILTASTIPKTGRPILHDTAVPLNVNKAKARLIQLQASQPVELPFLKDGQHGRHGHFVHDPDRRTGQEVHPEIKKTWEQNELWYNKFTDHYPGFPVNHLWPCGCEKLRGESENGESEEE